MGKLRIITCLMLVLTVGVPLPLPAKSKKDNVNDIGHRKVAGWSLISRQKELAIGTQYAKQLEHSSKMIKDPVVNEYVNRVEQNLAVNSDAKFPISVRVIDNPTVNAATLPGGFIFLNSGTILTASNQAELAAVLAHETGHVAERSWASMETKQELLSFAELPLMFTPMGIGAFYGIQGGLNGLPIVFMKFNRNQEEGADFLGVQYLWKAGYDPNAMVAMFGKILEMERQSPGSISRLFMDHPPTPDRIIKCEEEIKSLPKRRQYLLNTSGFVAIQRRLRSELTVHLHKHNPSGPTLERRHAPVNLPASTGTSGAGKNSGNQPPVLHRTD